MSAAVKPIQFPYEPEKTARPQPTRWVQVVSHLDPRYGGLSAAVPELGWSLAQGLGAAPVEVSLAAFCAPGEEYRPAGFGAEQVRYWPARRGAWMRDRMRGRGLRAAFDEEIRAVDGVHVHGLWEESTAVAAAAAQRLGKPYVISAHGMLEPWALAQKRAKKMLYAAMVERANVRRASCLHALTRAEARQFVRFGARSPIAIVPNAVECPADARPGLFLDEFPVLKGRRVVLFLARMHPKKGLDMLLDAWAPVAARHPEAHLVLAGPDSEGTEARLRKTVADHNLAGSVLFAGMLRGEMKWSALAAAELFVLPSLSEGLSVGVLEAMGMGVPVLITDACNMPEVTRAGAGWVIAPERHALREALDEVLCAAPVTNRAVGACGARLVRERYTWPVVSGQMAEVYAWVLGGRLPERVDMVFPA